MYAAATEGWDATEISALQTYAGLVATLLGTAAKAERRGRLTEQLQVSLDARNLIEQAKSALEELERLDDQQAFSDHAAGQVLQTRASRGGRRDGHQRAPAAGAGQAGRGG
jgi:hypothetical protein